MGVFPEPAHRADDVSRLAPSVGRPEDEAVAWLPRRGRPLRRHRGGSRTARGATLALGLTIGLGLPQTAFAPAALIPAAQAHGRIDESPRAARALAETTSADAISADAPSSENLAAWDGLPVAEQEPATAELIREDLAALPRLSQETGEDAVRFGTRSVPRRVVDTIVKAADEAGVDPAYMMALADKESSFDAEAEAATSSAQGLFQFVAATWLEMIRDHGARYGLEAEAAAVKGRGAGITVAGGMRARVLGLRKDPRVAAQMAAEMVKRDRGRIEARVGRALTATELYLAHLFGTASAGRFLSLASEKPDAAADRAFSGAARTNRALFTERAGGRRRGLTVAELHGRIEGMIESRLSRYQGVAAVAGATEAAPRIEVAAPGDAWGDIPADARRVAVSEALPPGGE